MVSVRESPAFRLGIIDFPAANFSVSVLICSKFSPISFDFCLFVVFRQRFVDNSKSFCFDPVSIRNLLAHSCFIRFYMLKHYMNPINFFLSTLNYYY